MECWGPALLTQLIWGVQVWGSSQKAVTPRGGLSKLGKEPFWRQWAGPHDRSQRVQRNTTGSVARWSWLLRDVESTHLVLLPLPALRRMHWGSFVQNPQQPVSGGVCWAGTLFWIISGPLQVDFCDGTLLREGEIRGLEMLLRTQSCLCEEAARELLGAHWSIRLPSRLFSHFWVSDELRTPLCSSSISVPGVSSPGN